MAYLMHELLKNKSTQRFILSLKTPQHQHQLSKVSPSLIPQQTHHFSLIQPENSLENDKSTEPSKLYPSFPFGYLLNPISSSGFDTMAIMEVEEEEVETEDDNAGKAWADSVKKKRKKKMNKHKYKKLRKRLRRKT
ncbi:hypothetical protein ERO13_A10G059400v2 [Gossypium hirsutum]|uniref:Small ribosomal subunit protein mS38 n=1 Tax=Gossypium hirsutum TaxID=3635 RepID=A0A1U8IKS6_GOSHI|nr:uncharacterized protein LOC107895733 [Gossypium hirsutum]KAG4178699.1 hypothetical protein ERO13_A10G059400v2 [Gossypium hirsutum]